MSCPLQGSHWSNRQISQQSQFSRSMQMNYGCDDETEIFTVKSKMSGAVLWGSSHTHIQRGPLNCAGAAANGSRLVRLKWTAKCFQRNLFWLSNGCTAVSLSDRVDSQSQILRESDLIGRDILNPLVPKSSSNHSSSGLSPSGPSDPAATDRIRLISRCISCSHCSAGRGGAAAVSWTLSETQIHSKSPQQDGCQNFQCTCTDIYISVHICIHKYIYTHICMLLNYF